LVEILKVSSKSSPNAVAGALAGVVRSARSVELHVVGAGALNQAMKAVAIARGYLVPSGIDLVCIPTFADIEINGERRTAIRLLCEDRERAAAVAVGEARAVTPLVATTVDLRAAEAISAAEKAHPSNGARWETAAADGIGAPDIAPLYPPHLPAEPE
jgi:stage V sporulation protein S